MPSRVMGALACGAESTVQCMDEQSRGTYSYRHGAGGPARRGQAPASGGRVAARQRRAGPGRRARRRPGRGPRASRAERSA